MHLYVYYDVPRETSTRLRESIRAMQRRLADRYAHQGRLLRRVGEDKARETWMEIYEHVDAAFEAHLKTAVEASGMANLSIGPRHIERFEDFD